MNKQKVTKILFLQFVFFTIKCVFKTNEKINPDLATKDLKVSDEDKFDKGQHGKKANIAKKNDKRDAFKRGRWN
jgi:hypothetical protein